MIGRLVSVIFLLTCAAIPVSAQRFAGRSIPGTLTRTLTVNGLTRSYLLHVPASYRSLKPMPLVLAFHGGGGDGRGMARLTDFDRLSERDGFLIAYPVGIDRQWHVAGISQDAVDDVGFVRAAIDDIAATYSVDRRRIYAAGISNGGFFAQVLACKLADRIAAIAAVAATLPVVLAPSCQPARPVSVALFLGTLDPLVPYQGGRVKGRKGRELQTYSAELSTKFWVERAAIATAPTTTGLPDLAPGDGTTVSVESYRGNTADVVVYTIHNGGHTWPGGLQYLPEALVGKTSRDFDAGEAIWRFFDAHPMRG